MTKKVSSYDPEILWKQFVERNELTPEQFQQFRLYYNLLQEANDIHNITAITDLKLILSDHFDDSLALCKFIDCNKVNSIADVGTGGGFPALPLKIKYPHLKCLLIEVNQKKSAFLAHAINQLKLEDIEITNYDWRTFLRIKDDLPKDIDLFCARASLAPEELIRVFMPSSPYKNSCLVYWASKNWLPAQKESLFITNEQWYIVGNKRRKLVFFSNDKNCDKGTK